MAAWGKCDFHEFKELLERLEGLEDNYSRFCESCAKELAARLLAKVIERTEPGIYPESSGKTGGTLRRGWTAKTEEEAKSGGKSDATAYVQALPVTKSGNMIQIEIINPVNYASYVEFGHRTRNHKDWVPGKFILTAAEQELKSQAPGIIERKLQKYFEGVFNGR